MNKRSVGETIKILREERRISQGKLATDLGLSRSSVGMYESGKRSPSPEVEDRICDYFNVDLNYLRGKTNVRNSARELLPSSQFGDHDANVEYLKNDPDLLAKYLELVQNDQVGVLFDKVGKLTPKQLKAVLAVIDAIDKEE